MSVTSCNFLDVDESTGKKEEDVYNIFDRVKTVVTNIYGYLPSDWGTIGGALREAATDNAEDLIQELTIQYNKTRQQSITNELLDIIGGSLK